MLRQQPECPAGDAVTAEIVYMNDVQVVIQLRAEDIMGQRRLPRPATARRWRDVRGARGLAAAGRGQAVLQNVQQLDLRPERQLRKVIEEEECPRYRIPKSWAAGNRLPPNRTPVVQQSRLDLALAERHRRRLVQRRPASDGCDSESPGRTTAFRPDSPSINTAASEGRSSTISRISRMAALAATIRSPA